MLPFSRNNTLSNKSIIRDFIKSWQSLDADKLAAYFTEDGVYHNMPAEPVTGRDNIKAFIEGFTAPWQATQWEVLSICEEGDFVIAERIDRIDLGEKQIELPCAGIFEMREGKISVWRDYFDLGTYMKAFE